MKTIVKVFIAIISGVIVMWLCHQVFHLEQTVSTVVAIMMVAILTAWIIGDRASKRK